MDFRGVSDRDEGVTVDPISNFFDSLLSGLVDVFVWILDSILAGVLGFLALLPCLPTASGLGLLALPALVAFVLNLTALTYAVYVFICAYTVRFLIRRLPFVG